MASPKRRVPPHRPDDATYEDHPNYGRQFGFPDPDSHEARMYIRGLAMWYALKPDAFEKPLTERREMRAAERRVCKALKEALDAGASLEERRALWYELAKKEGLPICFICGSAMHDGECMDDHSEPDPDMWEPVEAVDESERGHDKEAA